MPKVYLDRLEMYCNPETVSRAVAQSRREEDAQLTAMRRAAFDGGPHPFVMVSYKVTVASMRQRQREVEEENVLHFLRSK